MSAVDAGSMDPGSPVHVEIDRPQSLSRLLIFVKWLIALPHYVVLYVFGIVVTFVLVIAWFAVIIMGRYPRPLFDALVGYERWRLRVSAYLFLQTDSYPPFTIEEDAHYPVHLQIDYPERTGRWRPLLHWLLVIPVQIALAICGVAMVFVWVGAFFAILFTGSYPDGLFDLVTGYQRWSTRTAAYAYWMTGRYPV